MSGDDYDDDDDDDDDDDEYNYNRGVGRYATGMEKSEQTT